MIDNYSLYAARLSEVIELLTDIATHAISRRLDESIEQGNLGLKETIPIGKPEEPTRTIKEDFLANLPERLASQITIYIRFP